MGNCWTGVCIDHSITSETANGVIEKTFYDAHLVRLGGEKDGPIANAKSALLLLPLLVQLGYAPSLDLVLDLACSRMTTRHPLCRRSVLGRSPGNRRCQHPTRTRTGARTDRFLGVDLFDQSPFLQPALGQPQVLGFTGLERFGIIGGYKPDRGTFGRVDHLDEVPFALMLIHRDDVFLFDREFILGRGFVRVQDSSVRDRLRLIDGEVRMISEVILCVP